MHRLLLLLLGCLSISLRAQVPSLTAPRNGTAELELRGEPGNAILLEASGEVGTRTWETLTSLVLTNSAIRWADPWCGTQPTRFYRVTRSAKFPDPMAENFRLIDHLGRARELHYHWNDTSVKAFVLIFTANGCADVQSHLPRLKALRDQYASQGVVFWMINSRARDTRVQIAAEAARLGITWPILHDRAQNVARLYKTERSPEVICVDRETFGIFYRGAIDDRIDVTSGVATKEFLADALVQHMSGSEVIVRRTKPPGCEVTVSNYTAVSYSAEIAPLLKSKCVTCHSPGNIAPWAMTNHAIVKSYATFIRREVMAKHMPPWHADPQFGTFKNDFSLSPEQEAKLIAWIEQGAPRDGDIDPLEDVPAPPPRWPAELGPPDLIIRAPVQQIDPVGVEPYRYVFVQSGLTATNWIRAALVRPTNHRVVHHYLVWEDRSTAQQASGLAAYVPGTPDLAFPQGTGVHVTRGGGWLTFNLHYTPTDQTEFDQPELALWFHAQPPAKELKALPLLNLALNIPAGAADYQISNQVTLGQFPITKSITIHNMAPHMHYRGARMKFEVLYSNGSRETLLSVPSYHFHWQTTYQLAQPKVIPLGATLIVTGGYDNSPQNPYNPDPAADVNWGDQSSDEMFIGYFDYTEN